jgi:hypothetical protein
MEAKDWRNALFEDLKREGYIAVESLGLLTEKDIRTAMEAVRQSELGRSEDEEWNHIKRLRREREARLSMSISN